MLLLDTSLRLMPFDILVASYVVVSVKCPSFLNEQHHLPFWMPKDFRLKFLNLNILENSYNLTTVIILFGISEHDCYISFSRKHFLHQPNSPLVRKVASV